MPFSRRNFILGSATGLATLNHSQGNASARPIYLPKGAHVVVVGAGFAGIGAAELLIGEGYKVTHVEARDRIGGRAYSVDMGGFPADLGANWLRPNNNTLLPFAKNNGLVSNKSDMEDGVVAEEGTISKIDLDQAYALLEGPLAITYVWYHNDRRLVEDEEKLRREAEAAAAKAGSRKPPIPRALPLKPEDNTPQG